MPSALKKDDAGWWTRDMGAAGSRAHHWGGVKGRAVRRVAVLVPVEEDEEERREDTCPNATDDKRKMEAERAPP